MKVIDVSVFQDFIDWKMVKAAGIDGAIIRAGYGRGNVDETFYSNIVDAINAGIQNLGVYWFSYAYTAEMATNEAQYCHEVIKAYKDKLNLGVYFDWEYDSKRYAEQNGVFVNKKLVTDMNVNFCSRLTDLGYIAGYYLNYDYAQNYIDVNRLSKYRKWFAWYNEDAPSDAFLWQYTSRGSVAGINGNVDMDELLGAADTPAPAPAGEKNSNTDIAIEVINDQWGTGVDRMNRLAAAGYDYNAVQEIVNKYYVVAMEVLDGKWGNGYTRKNRLKKAGYDYDTVQKIVTDLKAVETNKTYIVQDGDTLTSIAEQFGTTVDALVEKNNIKDPNMIYAGDAIYV